MHTHEVAAYDVGLTKFMTNLVQAYAIGDETKK